MKYFSSAVAMAGILTVGSALAQNYSIDWFTIDGGGGTSTGGVFAVSGTIGQMDAGRMSGGAYTLHGGFWGAMVPVQQVGSPTLHIVDLLNGNVRIFWEPNAAGFLLEETRSLDPGSVVWTNAPVTVTNGAVIPASFETRFFRLIKP